MTFPHFLPLGSLVLWPLAVHGITVSTLLDEDNGSLGGGTGISLREAVKYSDAGDTIIFAPAVSGQTIRVLAGQIIVTKPLTIDGSALAVPVTLSGDRTGNGRTPDDSRVFRVNDVALSLHSLVFANSSNFSDSYGGGAIHSSGHSARLTINRCTFSGNHGISEGGAIYFYGAYQTPETALTIRDSTFSGNTASGIGGAIFAFGILDIQNTTITGNTAVNGGGIGIHYNTTALILHATITGNAATSQGGCAYNSGSLTIRNSIIGGNTSLTYPGIYGPYGNDQNHTSPDSGLAPLGDYGGPTRTMPPLLASPAVNTGTASDNIIFPLLTTDQRGFPRVSAPDIGAAEYQGAADLTRFWELDFDSDGSPYGVEQAVGTNPLVSDPTHPGNLAAPIIKASGEAVVRFGIGSVPAPGTRWSLQRSSDLRPEGFVEIYRYDSVADIHPPGISYLRTVSDVLVIDENPPPGVGFYRFEAVLDP